MRKQTLLFVFALALTLLAGCWNKPFDLEAWNAAENDYPKGDYERCAMGANLTQILPGMSRVDYGEMFNRDPESKVPYELIYVGACWLGCHGGGIVLIRVEFEDGKIVKAERVRS